MNFLVDAMENIDRFCRSIVCFEGADFLVHLRVTQIVIFYSLWGYFWAGPWFSVPEWLVKEKNIHSVRVRLQRVIDEIRPSFKV